VIQPAIRDLFLRIGDDPVFQKLLRRIQEKPEAPLRLQGLSPTARAVVIVLLRLLTNRQLVVVSPTPRTAESLHEAVASFQRMLSPEGAAGEPVLLPAFDVLPNQNLAPHAEIEEQRAIALWQLSAGRAAITIAPTAAALQRLRPAAFYRTLPLQLKRGDELPLEEVVAHLEKVGYQKREPVEMEGEYSIRGGILDVFAAAEDKPWRIEFFGDEVESVRRFDPETQRSVGKTDHALILPLREEPTEAKLLLECALKAGEDAAPVPGEAFAGWQYFAAALEPRDSNLFRLAKDALLLWEEPEESHAAADTLWKRMNKLAEGKDDRLAPDACYLQWGEAATQGAAQHTQLELRELDLEDADAFAIPSQVAIPFRNNVKAAVEEAKKTVSAAGKVLFFAPTHGEIDRLADVFREYGIPFQTGMETEQPAAEYLAERAWMSGEATGVFLVRGRLRRGCLFSRHGLSLFGSEDLFDTSDLVVRSEPQRKGGSSLMSAFSADISDLKPGDYIVHATHGIGRFLGIRQLEQAGSNDDFLLLEYAGESRLYVPLTRLDLVTRYRGSGESKPSLDKLGGVTWEKTRTRVRAKMRDMADELLKLYAARKLAKGFAFSADGNWQREFEQSFEFMATRDQVNAVKEIKKDMESTTPMDRLLVGDVGYGKTEVAMRAAFKALGDGRQVALLAPTTVLAFQHYETMRRRFAAFPARIEHISRFRSAKEVKQVVEDTKAGKVDILIGTHRLFSKDVEFADLGLVIIDEEQRFGVAHKEKLKQLRKNVDVLAMSATPIPRTLHMSLAGIRDLSVIETPPMDRLAVHTVVTKFDPELIRSAIEQEISRGGQVYYIHNRIDSIYMRAAQIQEMLPEARVTVGHGQMGEQALEKVLLGFMRHEADVFVATTIVENGIDVPLANTILIENSERYGLSELYQLRGRVGRSNRRAYAYLLVPQDTQLTEIAKKRLAALKEFSDLGAGFKIAALDLELRGAGSLLGGEQSGNIEAVGFDTYIRLLEEAMQEMKGETVAPEVHSTLNLGMELRIPREYISEETQRLRAYKKIADARDAAAAAKVLDELQDRYGPLPESVVALTEFARVKNIAEFLGVEMMERRAGSLVIRFHEQTRMDPERLLALVQSSTGASFSPLGVLKLQLQEKDPRPQLAEMENYLRRLMPPGAV
jgi:transcription-repair coupling factor (superfamily II helicase)